MHSRDGVGKGRNRGREGDTMHHISSGVENVEVIEIVEATPNERIQLLLILRCLAIKQVGWSAQQGWSGKGEDRG